MDTEALLKRFHDSYEVDPDTGCWICTTNVNGHGYGRVWNGEELIYAHRLSYRLHCGPIPEGALVRHLCHRRACVWPEHLAVGSDQDNMRDMTKAGRHAGPDGKGKLNPRKVREIRKRVDRGAVQKELAREYGVSPQTISDVVRRKSWKLHRVRSAARRRREA